MRRDEGGLAGVGEADQGHVGHQLQLQVEPAPPGPSPPVRRRSGPGGCWTGSGRCPGPPGPPRPASQRSPGSPRSAEHASRRGRGPGADRDRHLEVGPGRPCFLLARPVGAVVGPPVGVVPEGEQRGLVVVATSQTSPPWPPSPPSGPPLSTWASRRMETAPAPPSPAFMWIWHSSTNTAWAPTASVAPRPRLGPGGPPRRPGRRPVRLLTRRRRRQRWPRPGGRRPQGGGHYGGETDLAINEGEKGVIVAPPHARTSVEGCPAGGR